MDLHELVKLPHGQARKELIRAGLYDEDRGKPEREYEVAFEVTETEIIKVKARSEDEAINKAEGQVFGDHVDLIDVTEL